jgi:hypothetical protein
VTVRNPKLKNYTVTATARVSLFTRIKATSKKQALAIAQMRGGPGLCHQCSGAGDENEEFALSDGIDGEPDGLVAEEDE